LIDWKSGTAAGTVGKRTEARPRPLGVDGDSAWQLGNPGSEDPKTRNLASETRIPIQGHVIARRRGMAVGTVST